MTKEKTTEYLLSITVALAIMAIILPLKLRANENYVREKYIGPDTDSISFETTKIDVKPKSVSVIAEQPKIEDDEWIFSYEENMNWVNPSEYRINVTDEEIDLMARVVMSEASMLNPAGKQAVATVIVNRVLSDYKSFSNIKSVSDAIVPGQFSVAHNGYPDSECYDAVYEALMYEGFPTDMLFFWQSPIPPSGCHNYMSSESDGWSLNFFTVNDYSVE